MDDAVYEDILYRVVKKGFDADRLELYTSVGMQY